MKISWVITAAMIGVLGGTMSTHCEGMEASSVERNILQSEKEALAKSAAEARLKAYAPYSKYYVGAAVLTDSGKIFQGCNIENASYGGTCCAERVAIFKAVSEGELNIRATALVLKGEGTPCGMCRQILNEFNPEMLVILADTEGNIYREVSLSQLLPDAFGPHNLK